LRVFDRKLWQHRTPIIFKRLQNFKSSSKWESFCYIIPTFSYLAALTKRNRSNKKSIFPFRNIFEIITWQDVDFPVREYYI